MRMKRQSLIALVMNLVVSVDIPSHQLGAPTASNAQIQHMKSTLKLENVKRSMDATKTKQMNRQSLIALVTSLVALVDMLRIQQGTTAASPALIQHMKSTQ